MLTLDDYQQGAIGTAIYPGKGGFLGLSYVALKLNGEAGEFAEHLGKAIRDENFAVMNADLLPERKALLVKELGDVLWYVAAAAEELDVKLGDIAQGNLDKLADRKARGVLGGSGDRR